MATDPIPTFADEDPAEIEEFVETEADAPVSMRERFATLAIVVLSDITLFHAGGFAGFAALLAGSVVLLRFGSPNAQGGRYVWITFLLAELLVVRMLWAGPISHFIFGLLLLAAFAAAQCGRTPFVFEVLNVASRVLASGFSALKKHLEVLKDSKIGVSGSQTLAVLLPATAFVGFGMVFLLANPDLFTMFSGQFERVLLEVRQWLEGFSFSEMLFWGAAAFVGAGLLRPTGSPVDFDKPQPEGDKAPKTSALFPAFRNTLATLIGLFMFYLVYEFRTLWFREFPEGFYYSGYAHEGAAWLTIALAMATLVLSMIFRGDIFQDDRLPMLKKLAWVWSGLNLILATAVYNRLLIYVDFNGMTRMRIVGFFGITTVVVGFILVVAKIVNRHNFGWVIRRQLWTLACAVYFFLLLPVDSIWVRYNVQRILAGDLAPSVQLAVHPIEEYAVPQLIPLLECEDELVREGVRSLLATRDRGLQRTLEKQRADGWKAYQIGTISSHESLSESREAWQRFLDKPGDSSTAFQAYYDYAYQWY